MGTRSTTIIMEGDKELCRIYRQFDGYPDGHGIELAKLCDRILTNGISGGTLIDRTAEAYKTSNGMGELAAQIVTALKNDYPVGNIYLSSPEGEISDWVEYIYIVRGKEGEKPIIECTTKAGTRPFNLQTDGHVFTGDSEAWLKKYENPEDE